MRIILYFHIFINKLINDINCIITRPDASYCNWKCTSHGAELFIYFFFIVFLLKLNYHMGESFVSIGVFIIITIFLLSENSIFNPKINSKN